MSLEVIKILQELVIFDGEEDSLVFEFQSLGGGPNTNITDYDPSNSEYEYIKADGG